MAARRHGSDRGLRPLAGIRKAALCNRTRPHQRVRSECFRLYVAVFDIALWRFLGASLQGSIVDDRFRAVEVEVSTDIRNSLSESEKVETALEQAWHAMTFRLGFPLAGASSPASSPRRMIHRRPASSCAFPCSRVSTASQEGVRWTACEKELVFAPATASRWPTCRPVRFAPVVCSVQGDGPDPFGQPDACEWRAAPAPRLPPRFLPHFGSIGDGGVQYRQLDVLSESFVADLERRRGALVRSRCPDGIARTIARHVPRGSSFSQ